MLAVLNIPVQLLLKLLLSSVFTGVAAKGLGAASKSLFKAGAGNAAKGLLSSGAKKVAANAPKLASAATGVAKTAAGLPGPVQATGKFLGNQVAGGIGALPIGVLGTLGFVGADQIVNSLAGDGQRPLTVDDVHAPFIPPGTDSLAPSTGDANLSALLSALQSDPGGLDDAPEIQAILSQLGPGLPDQSERLI